MEEKKIVVKHIMDLTIRRDSHNKQEYVLRKLRCDTCLRIQKNVRKVKQENEYISKCVATCDYCEILTYMDLIKKEA